MDHMYVLYYTSSYVKENSKVYLFVIKTGQNTTYVVVFKDTHAAYLSLNFQ